MYHKFLGVNFLENLKSLTYPSIFELENSNFQEMFLNNLKDFEYCNFRHIKK